MSYPIKKAFLEGLPELPYRNGKGKYEGVVNHATATPEASDEAETKYFIANWRKRQAFAHFFCDWDSITQHADTDYKAWGAGNGNPRYVHVELCETKDEKKFKESYKRYVWLVAKLLHDRKLGVKDGVTCVSHDWVSKNLGGTNHADPIAYLKSHGITWTQHVKNVAKEYESFDVKAKPVFHEVLKQGSTGADVKLVQKELKLNADGIFGSNTEKAVIAFQKARKLEADGKVGKITWNALF